MTALSLGALCSHPPASPHVSRVIRTRHNEFLPNILLAWQSLGYLFRLFYTNQKNLITTFVNIFLEFFYQFILEEDTNFSIREYYNTILFLF